MRVQSFMGKANIDGIHHLDNQINKWLAEHKVRPVFVQQSFGMEQHHDGRRQEAVLYISLFYDEAPAE